MELFVNSESHLRGGKKTSCLRGIAFLLNTTYMLTVQFCFDINKILMNKIVLKIVMTGTGEMTQELQTFTTFARDPNLVSSIHIRQFTIPAHET